MRRVNIAVVLVAFFAALLVPGPVFCGGQTAKSALPQAIEVARKWQDDAVLVSLSTAKAQSDGTAAEWKYSFYSRKSQKRYVVTATGTQVDGREVRLGYSTEPAGEFIDSDKAMQEAMRNGLRGKTPVMGLKHEGTGKSAAFYWEIAGGYEKGDAVVTLEARTGKFVRRSVVE